MAVSQKLYSFYSARRCCVCMLLPEIEKAITGIIQLQTLKVILMTLLGRHAYLYKSGTSIMGPSFSWILFPVLQDKPLPGTIIKLRPMAG